MAKDSYYFSHDSNARHDPDICEMRADYGMEGYGMFWVVIEILRDQEDYKLKLCKCKAIAMQTQCEFERVQCFVNDCIEKYELFATDGEHFWSESLLRRMEKKDSRSEKARQSALTRWQSEGNANAMQTQCDGNAIKEKKGKEIKEKKNKKDIDAFFESVWKLYPEKTGRGKVSDAKKAKLYKYGYDVMALCIDRYKKYVAQRRATDFKGMLYQSGATFFNSGYVDYLDANYNQHEEEWRDTSFDQFYEN